MASKIIDLRSDTTTLPTKGLINDMIQAVVGDYAYGDDKAYNIVVDYCKELFKVEDAIFVTSGMLANRLAVMSQAEPGDEIITEYGYHINFFDSGATAKICGVVLNCVHSTDGILTIDYIKQAINSKPRYKTFAQVKLVIIENTINSRQGKIFPFSVQKEVYEYLQSHNISLHLDGARIFNAHVKTNISLSEYAKYSDTISFCFSKSLGAPFGSMLLGKKDIIEKAKKYQTWLGSGFHQIGFQAKAALYAIKHHVSRIQLDHEHATLLANMLASIPEIRLLGAVETNMVSFDISNLGITNDFFLNSCAQKKLLLFPWLEGNIRAVVHMGVTRNDIEQAYNIIKNVIKQLTQ